MRMAAGAWVVAEDGTEMASIPLFKSGNQSLDLFQTRLKSELDPVLSNIFVQGFMISAVVNPGLNTINHKLGRMQQGWTLTDMNGPATIWRALPFTTTTLTLNCSTSTTMSISLWVF